jgi:hypothetical protein
MACKLPEAWETLRLRVTENQNSGPPASPGTQQPPTQLALAEADEGAEQTRRSCRLQPTTRRPSRSAAMASRSSQQNRGRKKTVAPGSLGEGSRVQTRFPDGTPPVTPRGGAGLTRWSDKRLRQDARPSRAEAELAARPNETSRTTAAFDDESVSAETRCPAHGIRAA